mmetsp:Transcript_15670/g.37177  ORF Transcript_15670/g.37177 Transcript_15670/m.37177 type:complete len:283 (+) Transcript_15670:696-1544(+)
MFWLFRLLCLCLATAGAAFLQPQLQHDVPRVQVAVDELILEDHAHVSSEAVVGDSLAHILLDAENAPDAFRMTVSGFALLRGSLSEGNCISENSRQLSAHLPRKHQQLLRGIQRRWKANGRQPLEVVLESMQMLCLCPEVRLHLHVLAELLGCSAQTKQSHGLPLVCPAAEAQQPCQIRLQQALHPWPHALHRHFCPVAQLAEIHLRHAAAGVGPRLQRLHVQLLLEGAVHLCRLNLLRPRSGDRLVHSAKCRAHLIWKQITSCGCPLSELDEARPAAIDPR